MTSAPRHVLFLCTGSSARVTVCDDAAGEACPVWPGGPETLHWGLEEPAACTGSLEERRDAFLRTFRELDQRIGRLLDERHDG